MKERSLNIDVNMYQSSVEVIFTSDIFKSQDKRKMGISKQDCEKYQGMVAFLGQDYKVFLLIDKRTKLTHNTIAHEVFHLTHRLLEGIDDRFSVKHQEPYAYINGHITGLIYKFCKKWKIKVT